ncbi:carboxymethylenebutenolidase [Hortaea werneckii]|uniref:SnoaL-like domain-containing protein n=2 Tax=Hortaea werneckii TaxID=91943 RepID=A0A3M6YR62_HORWE|nr:carboxymethylenebutenolidase [Hortaea werneckii]KAI7525113.1 carboxymethylenebutenolidase [Hortaea werneckii]RMY05483.1 hypothetical protein D0868_06377 [Hortaea werneckii]
MPPRIHVTADDDTFDPVIIRHLREEGFDATFLPFTGDLKGYRDTLRHLADDLELGENYAIIAYGEAASICLDFYVKPQPHLVALVAYYPTKIDNPKQKYPSQLEILCHLASTQAFAPAFPSYSYSGVETGFAEHDLDSYNRVAASLAWSRTLGVLRKAFKLEVALEDIWEDKLRLSWGGTQDAVGTMATMVEGDPYVTHVPTMTGGIGSKELFLFYRDHFLGKNPPSLQMRLVSRTIGVDQVVDEMVVSFKHTQQVPWCLPDVPPTGEVVHIAIVNVVCIRGGKLFHEHLYWDQASVLVQVGLLDPKLVPSSFKSKGLKQLPVYGAETASKVLDPESQPTNDLISGWKDRPKGDPGALPNRPKPAPAADHS